MQPEQPGFDFKALMQRIEIEEPCSANWQEMSGDEQARFCAKCQLHVHNSLEMTDEQVLRALTRLQNGERICMRIYKRTDGTFLTKDCPFGYERLRLQAHLMRARTAAVISGVLAFAIGLAAQCAPAVKGKDKKPLWSGSVCASTAGDKKAKPKSAENSANKTRQQPLPVPMGGLPPPRPTPVAPTPSPAPVPAPSSLKTEPGQSVKEY